MKKVMRRKAHQERSSKKTTPRHSQVSKKARGSTRMEQRTASDVTYDIVQHDGGWAYKVDGVFSEAFPSHAEALAAAQSAAAEQELPGDAETIEYEDDKGVWRSETVSGRDRPHAVVKDSS
jgi:Uncharacterized protein conserved in bacteria (DUF2188)